MSGRGRRAALPAGDHSRPESLAPDGLVVHHYNRHGRLRSYDFSAKLAKRSCWGSLPNVFKEPLPDRAYADAQAQLKDLLSVAEFKANRRTVRNAHYHYTAPPDPAFRVILAG